MMGASTETKRPVHDINIWVVIHPARWVIIRPPQRLTRAALVMLETLLLPHVCYFPPIDDGDPPPICRCGRRVRCWRSCCTMLRPTCATCTC